ncbi:MAG: TRAP transporter large permease subunit [Desulfotignum sp.]|nr:TRAP transporter large permease subunit [Desulfotignum sp.]
MMPADKFLGGIRGGLAMATGSACTAFGAVCGSSPATAATMATVGLPEMKRYNYNDELATGSVASGGGIGMIMPPSVVAYYLRHPYRTIHRRPFRGRRYFRHCWSPCCLLSASYIRCSILPGSGPPGRNPFSLA